MTVYTQTFGTDQSPLAGDFTLAGPGTSPGPGIVATGGQAVLTATNGGAVALLSSGKSPTVADGPAQVVFGTAGGSVSVLVRAAGNGNPLSTRGTGYRLTHSGSTISLAKRLPSDAATDLVPPVNHVRSPGQTMRLVPVGSLLIGLIDGREVIRATDSTYTAAGRTGFSFEGSGTAIRDFATGTVAEMATVPSGGPTAPPGKVTGVTVTLAGQGAAGVAWNAQQAAAAYIPEYRVVGSPTLVALPQVDVPSAEISDLVPDHYETRITGVNTVGPGTPSDFVPFTIEGTSTRELRVPLLDDFGQLFRSFMPEGYTTLPELTAAAGDVNTDFGATVAAPATPLTPGRVRLSEDLAGTALNPKLAPKPRNQRLPLPTLQDLGQVATRAQIGLGTIYVPWIVRVPDEVYAAYPALGRWRIYTSTDHDSAGGGIAMMYTDALDPTAPGTVWSFYRTPGGSPVLHQEGGSAQVETPCVLYNPKTGRFHLYYQNQTGSGSTLLQTTRVATSVDGVTNWTVVGDAIPNQPTSIAGYAHTGYARVYFIDGLWCAWHLLGGGTGTSGYGWSYSYDGLRFVTDRRRVGADLQDTDGVLRLGISSLINWRGDLYGIGTQQEYTSGTATSGQNITWVAPMREDLRGLQGRPQRLPWLDPLGALSADPPGPSTSWASLPDGRLLGATRREGATTSTDTLRLVVLS